MNALRVPYEAYTSVVGCASEGSACLREAASAKAGPTKHVEEPRALARGGPLVQFIAYCHIAIESQSMRSNKGDGSIYFKFSIPENRAVPFSFRLNVH
jgi:hypothetical protein